MRIGVVIEETWDFFHEVYADLSQHHQTRLFERPRPIGLGPLDRRLNDYRFRRGLRRFLRDNDVVFFEWASELLAVASHMPKVCGIVTRLHRYEMYQWAHKINWAAVDVVILVSQAKLREFTAAFPEHAQKAVVIPEAVSVKRFRPSAKTYAGDIGILCHLKPRKRVYELILAFSELVQERPHFHLHIGGGRAPGRDDYHDALVQLVERLDLREKVTFYGHVSTPEEWYPLIDVFVSNGFSEGLQVSPMEAIASGCYSVAHRWDGADELLPESSLYDTDTQLRNLLLRYDGLLPAERERSKVCLRTRVYERFNVDITKTRIRRLVEDAAGRTGVTDTA